MNGKTVGTVTLKIAGSASSVTTDLAVSPEKAATFSSSIIYGIDFLVAYDIVFLAALYVFMVKLLSP